MRFTKIAINTENLGEDRQELLFCELTDLGAEGFEIGGGFELSEIPSELLELIDEELLEKSKQAIGASVTVYIPENEQGEEFCANIAAFLHGENLEYSTETVNEEDWENNWKQYFLPLEVGERLLIKPSWVSEYENRSGRTVLEIDPASAFGTGQHVTTRLCLELLEKHLRVGDSVADIGCGSGILSAAAGLLGAGRIRAVDISQNAADITRDTLRINNVEEAEVFCGNILDNPGLCKQIGDSHDIVVANITADVIVAMAELFTGFMKEGGRLILSGIIEHRLPEVIAAIIETVPLFTLSEKRESEGWFALICHRKII
ncbi:MAG: 50S ribosomal protein L11 methyltransferase [Oscillospiraceae bacterium]|nr:50S ribosomal protein L11 methyltransferase [Oscillospiraceae bacterium]